MEGAWLQGRERERWSGVWRVKSLIQKLRLEIWKKLLASLACCLQKHDLLSTLLDSFYVPSRKATVSGFVKCHKHANVVALYSLNRLCFCYKIRDGDQIVTFYYSNCIATAWQLPRTPNWLHSNCYKSLRTHYQLHSNTLPVAQNTVATA